VGEVIATILFWTGIVLFALVLGTLLRWVWQDEEDQLMEDTMKARARNRTGEEEEDRWL